MRTSNDNQQFFFFLNREQQPDGPHSLAELRELAKCGVLQGDALVSAEGWPAWKTWNDLQAEQQAAGVLQPQAADPARVGSMPAPREACVSQPPGEAPVQARPEPVSTYEAGPAQPPAEDHFPWEVSPEIARKAVTYEASGTCRVYDCRGDEFLNRTRKREIFRDLKYLRGQLRIYPDLIGIFLPKKRSHIIMRWVETSPWPLRPIPILLNDAVSALLLFFYRFYLRGKAGSIAQRILQDPKSSYAIKKLFKLSALSPRFWHKAAPVGEVVQIIRADTRHGLSEESLLVLVQDTTLENRSGCLTTGDAVLFRRLFKGERRIFVLALDGGASAADNAAAAMSRVLGVPVSQAKFKFNRFLLT